MTWTALWNDVFASLHRMDWLLCSVLTTEPDCQVTSLKQAFGLFVDRLLSVLRNE